MSSAFGAKYEPVQLGMCLGGLIATWSADSPAPQLWSVEQSGLPKLMYRGRIGKVARSADQPDRYREAGSLDAVNKTLAVQVDGEAEPRLFALGAPKDINPRQTWFDLGAALISAIRYVAETPGRVLLLERGGLVAPREPFALFTLAGGEAVVEARPAPAGSKPWAEHFAPGASAALVRTPISDQALRSAGFMMAEAARTWGVTPWDLALTFGAGGDVGVVDSAS